MTPEERDLHARALPKQRFAHPARSYKSWKCAIALGTSKQHVVWSLHIGPA